MSRPRPGIEELCAHHRVTVVGVGNELRGDDGVGPFVARRLAAEHPGRAVDAGCVPENHLGVILATIPELVLFVDAADLGGVAGAWRVARVDELEPRCESTHDASLALLARLFEAQDVECRLLGIQPARNAPGVGLSEPVRAAGELLAWRLARVFEAEAARA